MSSSWRESEGGEVVNERTSGTLRWKGLARVQSRCVRRGIGAYSYCSCFYVSEVEGEVNLPGDGTSGEVKLPGPSKKEIKFEILPKGRRPFPTLTLTTRSRLFAARKDFGASFTGHMGDVVHV